MLQKLIVPFVLLIFCHIALAEPQSSVIVTNVKELEKAVRVANKKGGNVDIQLEDGLYQLKGRLMLKAPNITIRSRSGNRDSVVLRGKGMVASKGVQNLIDVQSANISVRDITLEQATNHLIQLHGVRKARDFHLKNAVLRDSFQQLLKSSRGKQNVNANNIINVVIEDSVFEYSNALGPQFYIGGIDAHGAENWVIKNNVFRNIASPSKSVAQHAIHLWNFSKNNIIENNLIVNCDRGIGLGLGNKDNQHDGAEIQGNMIINTRTNNPFSDVGIGIESALNTKIIGNTILLFHDYPNAIEVRFPRSKNNIIEHNTINREITTRNRGSADIMENIHLNQSTVSNLKRSFSDLLKRAKNSS